MFTKDTNRSGHFWNLHQVIQLKRLKNTVKLEVIGLDKVSNKNYK